VLGGGQDLLQTGEQLNLDVTPERHPLTRDGGLAQAMSPDALLAGNDEVPIGQELPLQDQNLSHAGAQGGEEAIVTEFSLLVGGCALVKPQILPLLTWHLSVSKLAH